MHNLIVECTKPDVQWLIDYRPRRDGYDAVFWPLLFAGEQEVRAAIILIIEET